MHRFRISKKGMIAILLVVGIVTACTSKDGKESARRAGTEQESEAEVSAPVVPEPELQLSQEQMGQITYLVDIMCRANDPDSLSDKPILEEDTEEAELEAQANFLSYMSTEDNVLSVTMEEINQLIRMAGGSPNSNLQTYLEDEYYGSYKEGELFTFHYMSGEVISKVEIEEVSGLKDGSVKVTGQMKREVMWESGAHLYDGKIWDMEAILIPNEESVFGGYSLKHLWKKTRNPAGSKEVGKDVILPPYQKPEAMSDYAFDYIFELDGDRYQMPVPMQELEGNGWECLEDGALEPGERANIHLAKEGITLSGAIWNYGQNRADYKDCVVVWLNSKFNHTWADVAFQVGGIKNQSTVFSQPLAIYDNRDPLYNDDYGYSIHVENGSAVGFEIGYAPVAETRRARAALLTGWEEDPVYDGVDKKEVNLEWNQIYDMDIDQDGKKEALDLTCLDQVEWGKERLCILIDGEVSALINEWQFDTLEVTVSIEEQGTFLHVKGFDDYGMDSTKKFLLHKKQAKEIQETGWRQIGEESYYLEVENGVGRMAVGFREIDGNVYYYASNGIEQTGLLDIDGLRYFFYPSGQLARTEWVEDPLTGQEYWADEQGACTEKEEPSQIEIGGQQVWSDVTWLNLNNCKISDLKPLESLKYLTDLDLSNNQISDLTPLKSLKYLTDLDLWSNQISDVAPLESLTNLTQLNLGKNQISDITSLGTLTELTQLDLNNNQISELTPLGTLTNLIQLNLNYNQIRELKPLETLTSLIQLDLGANQIMELNSLETLENLKRLNLFRNQISELNSLGALTNLTQLNLENNQISRLDPLGTLTNLKKLRLGYNQISELNHLKPLTNLTELDLVYNQISQLEPLETLTNLRELRLTNNRFRELAPLEKLPNMTILHLNENQISDVEPLKKLTNLTELELKYNQIGDLKFLGTLTNLTVLDLDHNQISDLKPLKTLTNLTVLGLEGNQISDLTPLQELETLSVLSLRENQISDLTPLQSLVGLEILSLHNNKLTDIAPVQYLVNLKQLNFWGDDIHDIKPLASLTQLEELACIGNQISDVTPLQDLHSLRRLYLWGNPIRDVTPLKSLTDIKFIDLEGTPLTQLQVDELQSALPDCEIDFPDNPRIWEAE